MKFLSVTAFVLIAITFVTGNLFAADPPHKDGGVNVYFILQPGTRMDKEPTAPIRSVAISKGGLIESKSVDTGLSWNRGSEPQKAIGRTEKSEKFGRPGDSFTIQIQPTGVMFAGKKILGEFKIEDEPNIFKEFITKINDKEYSFKVNGKWDQELAAWVFTLVIGRLDRGSDIEFPF